MNIDIYSSDVRDLDEVIERQFDISNYYGTSLFDKHGRLIPQDEYEFAIEPYTYLALMMDMQEQINDLHKTLMQLEEELNAKL
tara:strand:- start:164 stop:412 length:249 start_codon:yes stop_codon:yes gene_type:complete